MCARSSTSAAPRIEQRVAQPYVAIAVEAPIREWGEVAVLVSEMLAWVSERGIAAAGAPFLRHWVAGDRDRPSILEVGVPIPHVVTGDDRVAAGGFIPAGRYAVLDHHDHPARIGESLQMLEAWGARQGVAWRMNPWDEGMEVWGGRFEFFPTDAADHRDPSRWRIEIAFLLSDEAIRGDAAGSSTPS